MLQEDARLTQMSHITMQLHSVTVQDRHDNEQKQQVFLSVSQALLADPTSILSCLHRLKCIPSARERHSELLPEMRTGIAEWGGMKTLSQHWLPDLLLLFKYGNTLLGASPPEGLAVQPRFQPRAPQSSAGELLTLPPSSPDVARHRQAGKKEAGTNQHGEQDL